MAFSLLLNDYILTSIGTICCPVCKKVFKGKSAHSNSSRHKREVHRDAAEYTCPHPDCLQSRKRYSRKNNLLAHVKRVHGQEISSDLTVSHAALTRITQGAHDVEIQKADTTKSKDHDFNLAEYGSKSTRNRPNRTDELAEVTV